MTYYEELATARPFDDSDGVLSGAETPNPPRSWQHFAARSALAYVLNIHYFRDTFSLKLWPHARRVQLVNDICKVIETGFKPNDQSVSYEIFSQIRTDKHLDNEFRCWIEDHCEDEFEQMIEDIYAVITDIHANSGAA